jgi:hypothetical protein
MESSSEATEGGVERASLGKGKSGKEAEAIPSDVR